MKLNIRRMSVVIDDKNEEAGHRADEPLRKVAVIAVIENPFIDRYVEDLSPLIDVSEELGRVMAERAVAALAPYKAASYGKGGIVGVGGEQEHANALITTTFAKPLREAIGDATAWISSMTKVAAPGTPIDIPMNAKTNVYVRSHYDGMSLMVPGAPARDEIVVIFCLASRGRLNARVGGMSYSESLTPA
jgi:hypothetical protein